MLDNGEGLLQWQLKVCVSKAKIAVNLEMIAISKLEFRCSSNNISHLQLLHVHRLCAIIYISSNIYYSCYR